MFKGLLMITLGAVLIGGCAQTPAATPDTSAEEAKLKADLVKWMDDFNAGNVEAVANQYATDAVLMPPNTPAANGHDAIKNAIAAMNAEMKPAGRTLKSKANTGIGVSGDFAWMSGTYAVMDSKGATLELGKYLSVHHKLNGTWQYIRDTWNSDAPPPAPAPTSANTKK